MAMSHLSGGGAADPRTSLALVFRRVDATLSQPERSLTKKDATNPALAHRLGWVASALEFFRHWYVVPPSLQALVEQFKAKAATAE